MSDRDDERTRASEERLRLAMEVGRVGAWDWDVRSKIISWTPSMYAIHGIPEGAFDGGVESFARLVHPEDRERVRHAFRRGVRSGEPYALEFRTLRDDGVVAWLYTSVRVFREHGRTVRMLGASVDIDARKRTEIALRESEERFAKAFNATPISMTLASIRTGKLLEVNDAFVRMSGYTREEALGRSGLELHLWSDPAERSRVAAGLLRDGKVRNLEARLRSRTGREYIGLVSSERILVSGDPVALTVVLDVTDMHRTQAALRQSEARLRLALSAANAGVWSYDPQSARAHWSEELRALFGCSAPLAPRLSGVLELIHRDDRGWVEAQLQALLGSYENEFRQEFRAPTPQGERWIQSLGRIERAADGRAQNVIGIMLDITRSKEVERELRLADQRKNEFIATLAHELRNPLAPVRSAVEILEQTGGRGESAQRALQLMDRQVKVMMRLIDDMLDLSRISRGVIELRCEPVELTSIIETALEISRPLIERAGQTLSVAAAPESLIVHADSTRLTQVFANLLNNASNYTPEGGKIGVDVRRDADDAVVRVSDSGVGLPAHAMDAVFDLFTQVHGASSSGAGLGIGLNIARRLVDMHGGSIKAASAGPNQGSEFTVTLPLDQAVGSRHQASGSSD